MAVTRVPEQIKKTCDRCGWSAIQGKTGFQNFVKGAKLNLDQAALDFQGMPVANGGQSYDLCDNCATKAEDIMEKFIQSGKP